MTPIDTAELRRDDMTDQATDPGALALSLLADMEDAA